MASALTIITEALSRIGCADPRQEVGADEAQQGLSILNQRVQAFSLDHFLMYAQTEIVQALPSATRTLTIGPGGQVNISRPVEILPGSFVRFNGIDYPFRMIDAQMYGEVADKNQQATAPLVCYYNAGSPIGTLSFYPINAQPCELHLHVWRELDQFADLQTDYSLPQGYQSMLSLSLSEDLCPFYGMDVSPTVAALAANARRCVKRSNHNPPILQIDLPSARSNSTGNWRSGA